MSQHPPSDDRPAADASDAPGVIRWERDPDDGSGPGVVTLVLDDPARATNTMNPRFTAAFTAAVDRLEAERDTITGVIVTSGKSTFFAGGDLRRLVEIGPDRAEEVFDGAMAIKRAMRRLETLGRPVVAAMNGSALGGGYEIALACHHRLLLDTPGCRVGLPEVTLGLLPGTGGVVRSVRLLGITGALSTLLLEGRRYSPAHALEQGLVDEVVDDPAELLSRARAWIAAHPDARQPWDAPGHRIPGGAPSDPGPAALLPALPARLTARTGGAPAPAPQAILAAAVEGAAVDIESAQIIESRYFTSLVTGPVATNMIRALFFDRRTVEAGARRPAGVPERPVARAAVLGAGMMGAGIAHVLARAGIEVVLKDLDAGRAARGRDHCAELMDREVERGRLTARERQAVLDRLTPTADPADLAGCDALIEAVVEDPAVKAAALREAVPLLAPDALLCTNTSTLPIADLARSVDRPTDFLGLHFFSPVERMPLVEIVRGADTGDEAVARAFDLVRRLRKTPIVVNDARGFFTSRVIGRFLDEGLRMVGEGVAPASIERACLSAGYPTPVLALLDELTLTLPLAIRRAARAAGAGPTDGPDPAERVLERMVEEFGRTGRAAGAGFHEYDGPGGRRSRLWPGLREHFAPAGTGSATPTGGADPAAGHADLRELRERMLFAESLEAMRALEEGVVECEADATVGSLLGIGFPAWTGGVLRYADGWPTGAAGFLERARELRERHGERFEPPAWLVERVREGRPVGGAPR
ncbi:3-hydroxyacyl-CoA dehydrogenase NAD-binding domain-containing protein [Streptomyces alkaliphilus]|uniref:3-hydroxyacyl-CoA dehydrogenase NAD-binding domain-containing protein n=1 Tax=Streptomyces alkaliphilus TaxID=1472722 RepID=UPI00118104AA|nr:3-hydroxyacyl-CoA dehydrogenase NAD-binding domain-containing protein [Streptomyces alkaliphilus]MQS09411.1 3-hydroxyacyl-CoA dehydrogenase [Streptomyces alkaliphilus]